MISIAAASKNAYQTIFNNRKKLDGNTVTMLTDHISKMYKFITIKIKIWSQNFPITLCIHFEASKVNNFHSMLATVEIPLHFHALLNVMVQTFENYTLKHSFKKSNKTLKLKNRKKHTLVWQVHKQVLQ